MKINNLPGVLQTYTKQAKVQNPKDVQKGKSENDAMNVSGEAKTFSAVFQAAKKAPEIREDKVNAIKQAIANDEYKIDDEQVVDKLIESMSRDKRSF